MFSPSSPVTGAAQTGLTTPTYTLNADNAPSLLSKQWFVSALGGTQTGVVTHSVARPFTLSIFRPGAMAQPPVASSNGIVSAFPRNVFKRIVRKSVSVSPDASVPKQNVIITVTYSIPAGAETYDEPNVRAALSLSAGLDSPTADALFDSFKTGTI